MEGSEDRVLESNIKNSNNAQSFSRVLIVVVATSFGGCFFGGARQPVVDSPPHAVPIATLHPESLDAVFFNERACPGAREQLAILIKLPDREILASRGAPQPVASFPEPQRPRISAAVSSNDYVDLSELEVSLRGPATTNERFIVVEPDVVRSLDGPITVAVSIPSMPEIEPGTDALTVRLECNYTFERHGRGGRVGHDGVDGGTNGSPGGPGDTGGDGEAGPEVQVFARPFRGPDGREWIQALARDVTAGQERAVLLPPGSMLTVAAEGGSGGDGGRGGRGGNGADEVGQYPAGDGGEGGAGGVGGRGGPGGRVAIVVSQSLASRVESFLRWSVDGGAGGYPGAGGRGGAAGAFWEGSHVPRAGYDGPPGQAGPPGLEGSVTMAARRVESLFDFDATRLARTFEGQAAAQPMPAVTQPAVTQPAVTQPAVTQPAVTQPAATTVRSSQDGSTPIDNAATYATGRWVVVPMALSLRGQNLASLASNGEITIGRRVRYRLLGGTVFDTHGKPLMTLSRDGTLRTRMDDEFHPIVRIRANGHMSWVDNGLEVRVASSGRITSRGGGVLESRFDRIPRRALRTASLLVYLVAGRLR